MKNWKLISGILSIVLAAFVFFQSMASGFYDSVSNGDGTGMASGAIVGLLLIAGGIVSIVTKKSTAKGGNIALIVLYGIAALIGFFASGSYSDLQVWGGWCLICAVIAVISLVKNNKNNKSKVEGKEV